MFRGDFKAVSSKFPGCFEEDRGVLQETLKGDSRELQWHLKEVQRIFQWTFEAVSKTF